MKSSGSVVPRIAIVGGGISGLSAALELSLLGESASFCLYEASSRLGGVLETIYDGPYLVERSADNFATLLPAALELTRQFGNESQLIHPVEQDRRAFVLHGGKLLPIPIGFSLMQPTRVRSILSTATLSTAGKLRLLGEMFVPPRKDKADESLKSFATRRLGREVYENLVEPIVSGIFTADPSKLSMQACMPQFVELERKHGSLIRGHWASQKSNAQSASRRASGARYDQFLAPRRGISSWIADLAKRLPESSAKLSTSVVHLERVPHRWRLSTSQEEAEFDGLILATPAPVSARLLHEAIPEAARLLGSIEYASSVVVALIVAKHELRGRIDGFGMINPRKEGRPSLAISYTSNKYPGRVPEDQILLRIFFGGALDPSIVHRDDQSLIQLAYRELRELLGWKGNTTCWQAVIRWPEAMPQYSLGHVQRVDSLMDILDNFSDQADNPAIAICGAGYRGVGIPQCVRSGREAARQLLQTIHGSR